MNNQKGITNGIVLFLKVIGFLIIGLGFFGTLIISTLQYGDFDFVIFFTVFFSACISGSIILGLGEITDKLHRIHLETQSIKCIESKMCDVIAFQQGILDELINSQSEAYPEGKTEDEPIKS